MPVPKCSAQAQTYTSIRQLDSGTVVPLRSFIKFKEFLEKNFGDDDHAVVTNIEHVYKGAVGKRQMTPITIVELDSRSSREMLLKRDKYPSIKPFK